MRKLDLELNIQAMYLYHYFRTKDELISYIADSLVFDIYFGGRESTSDNRRTIMLIRAMSAKTLFQEHSWLPLVVDSQIQGGIKK